MMQDIEDSDGVRDSRFEASLIDKFEDWTLEEHFAYEQKKIVEDVYDTEDAHMYYSAQRRPEVTISV